MISITTTTVMSTTNTMTTTDATTITTDATWILPGRTTNGVRSSPLMKREAEIATCKADNSKFSTFP